MAVIAEREFTSRATLRRVEAGDSAVSIGIYAAVRQAPGLLDGLQEIADAAPGYRRAVAASACPATPWQRREGRPWLMSKYIFTIRPETPCGAFRREPLSAGQHFGIADGTDIPTANGLVATVNPV